MDDTERENLVLKRQTYLLRIMKKLRNNKKRPPRFSWWSFLYYQTRSL